MSKFLSILLLSISQLHALPVNAQHYIRCYTMEMIDHYEKQFPGSKTSIQQANESAIQWLLDHPEAPRSLITVPVVVHVVYHTAAENIPDEQIFSQIDVLNEDFRKKNADTSGTPDPFKMVAADCMIEFCLAAVDPNGNQTSGITRDSTTVTVFDGGDVKSVVPGWPSGQYLNIWVCNLTAGLLGIATPPGMNSSDMDGVEVHYKAFGRKGDLNPLYNFGRTCTHEVGHWLGLSHIWGDDHGQCNGSDQINDTPNQADYHFDCPDFPFLSCNNGGDMLMNYMDYTPDACMNLFTKDQAAKMNAILETERLTIQSSPAGCQPLPYKNDGSISKIVFPADTIDAQSFWPWVQITNKGDSTLTSLGIEYQVDGQVPDLFSTTCTLAPNESQLIELNFYSTGEGDHVFTAWSSLPNNTIDENPHNDTASRIFTVVSSIPKNTMTVYPMPTNGTVTIAVENPSDAELDLRVVNAIGQVVRHYFISLSSQSTFNIDLSDLANGIYFLYGKIGYDYVSKKMMVWK